MALVASRGGSSLQLQRNGNSSQFGSTINLMSTSDFSVPNNNQNRHIVSFLSTELRSSWHPSFRYTTVAIRNIADCLHAVSSQKLAGMKVICCPDGDTSLPYDEYTSSPYEEDRSSSYRFRRSLTIRDAAESCRKLCSDAILEMQNDMDIIDRQCRDLHGTHGPLSRLLRAMFAGNISESILGDYIRQARKAHDVIFKRQTRSVEKWHSFAQYISSIKSALNEQLQILDPQKALLRSCSEASKNDLATAQAELRELDDVISALRGSSQEVTHNRDSLVKELKSVKTEIQKHRDEIPVLELVVKELEEDIKLNESELQKDKRNEQQRRDITDKEAAEQGLLWSLWGYYTNGGAEREIRSRWDREAEMRVWKLDKQKSDRSEKISRLRQLNHELKKLDIRKSQLEDGRLQTAQALASEYNVEPEIRQLQNTAEQKRSNIKILKAELDNFDSSMKTMEEYEAVVPGICGHFGEMETNVTLTYNGYNHTLRKLHDYGPKFENIVQRIQRGNGKDIKDIIEDTLHLRYSYIVIQFMSRTCSLVCRDVYAEGLLAISHLGTVPSRQQGDFTSSSRAIHPQTAERDIDRMYRRGGRVAKSFDNFKIGKDFENFEVGKEFREERIADEFRDAQTACFFALGDAIRDVAESTPSRSYWPDTGSRFRNWRGIRRRQEIEDWAVSALGQGDTIHELPGERA